MKFTEDELKLAYFEVNRTIEKCERIQPKFNVGTSQHTLLINRINALVVSKTLIHIELGNSKVESNYSECEFNIALKPILSIIHKCEMAQSKYEFNSKNYNRFLNQIRVMYICKDLIENQLNGEII